MLRLQRGADIWGYPGMHGRESAKTEDKSGAADLPGGTEVKVPAAVSALDRLEYIADMVQELKIMSAQASCQALTDLLECAYREAVRQIGTRT